MKKRGFFLVLFVLCLSIFGILYIFSELSTEEELTEALEEQITDADTFKKEYESENDKELPDGTTLLKLSIDENNPFIYKDLKDIIDMINNKETFIVYFSYSSCAWCRNGLETLIASAKENNIDKIYYVDISSVRDTYELNENNEAVRTVEGTAEYYELLTLLDSVLEDYEPLTYVNSKGKTKKVTIDEKRIYAPNIIAIKEGVPVYLTTGLDETEEDASVVPTEEQTANINAKLKELYESLNNDQTSNVCVDQKC